MDIDDDHVDWAVVQRLRRMLDQGHAEFEVTHTFALFTSMLCWVAQCIRDEDNEVASNVFTRLEPSTAEQDPWLICTSDEVTPLTPAGAIKLGPFREFAGMSASRFIVALRNAAAHGDARTLRPYRRWNPERSRHELEGFQFTCSEKDRRTGKLTWRGTVILLESDMRRIATHLGDLFCNALRRGDAHRHDGHFGKNAMNGIVEPNRAA